jgi:nicotinamide-nucleotide amidase
LKVNEDTIKRYGAVSEQTAKEMAVGVRKLSGVDIGMATTGIAGPTGATEKKPVGLVYVAIACEKDVYCREYRFTGHRLAIKEKVTVHALDFLRRILGSGLDM